MHFHRLTGGLRLGLVVATVVGLCGCGGSGHRRTDSTTRTAGIPATTTTSTSSTATTAQTADYQIVPGALVTMRQFSPESLLWQTVSLSRAGQGMLTTLIGEVSGAKRRPFRLPAHQTIVLRQLVALARTVKPPATSNPRAMMYTLYITGAPSASIQGRAPKQLSRLIDFLSAMMQTYCC